MGRTSRPRKIASAPGEVACPPTGCALKEYLRKESTMIHLGIGRCIGTAHDGRRREGTSRLRVAALGVAICTTSAPALAQTHAAPASPSNQPTFLRKPAMTQLTT